MTTPNEATHFIPEDPAHAEEFVRRIAKGVRVSLPRHVDLEDLVAAGYLGYTEALGRWQPGKGAQFHTYAHYRVKGAIIDAVRCMARVAARFKPTDFGDQDDATMNHQCAGTWHAAAELRTEVARIGRQHWGQLGSEAEVRSTSTPHDASPDEIAAHREQVELLQTALACLSAEDRQLLGWIHHDELSLAQIGERIGKDKAAVFRRHQAALARLRTAFLATTTLPVAAIA